MPILAQAISLIDWSIVAVFLVGVVSFGLWVGRKQSEGADFFLAGRNIPAWAAAISFVATFLSAATFVGGPADAFKGNWAYLILNVGSMLGGLVAAFWLIPAAWRAGGATPYAVLEQRFGPRARAAAAVAFLAGRVLASSARHFITGTAFCMIVFGRLETVPLIGSILVIGLLGTLYAAKGGVKSVIWTDVVLFSVLMVAVVASVVVIWRAVPADGAAIWHALEAKNKCQVLDFSMSLSSPYTVWAALASTAFYAAAYGTDQDMAQRMLTTRSPKAAARSLIMGVVAGLPLIFLFLVLGSLLWVFYGNGGLAPVPADAVDKAEAVFPQFMRNHLPVGVKGLAIAGLLACSLGALASAISAMAASVATDFGALAGKSKAQVVGSDKAPAHPRAVSVAVGLVLTLAACGCALGYDPKNDTLLQFALKVMTPAYCGLLGVFAVALLTKRGNALSVVCGLLAGIGVAGTLYFVPVVPVTHADGNVVLEKLAFPWVMALGSLAAFVVCVAEKGKSKKDGIIFDA